MSGNNHFKRWVTAVSKQSGDREKKQKQKKHLKNILPRLRNFIHKLESGPFMTNKNKQDKTPNSH